MKRIDNQLRRLLRGAAAARQKNEVEMPPAPRAAWLLARRDRYREPIFAGVFPILSSGLALACLLLGVMAAVSFWEIRGARSDAFNASQSVARMARGVSFP